MDVNVEAQRAAKALNPDDRSRPEGPGHEPCLALDPETHHPVEPAPRFEADLSCLGNGLPDREPRVEEFFFSAAHEGLRHRFLLGGNGWQDHPLPDNLRYVGHVYTRDPNAFNCSARTVLNISRESQPGKHGALRPFPGDPGLRGRRAGACLITDAWEGIEPFLAPGEEVLAAHNRKEVIERLGELSPERAEWIGTRALARVARGPTYTHRAAELKAVLEGRDLPA